MIDRKWIGYETPVSVLPIERSRLQFFAKVIGETQAIYTDREAALAAGYPDLPAPPTFLFAAELDSGAVDDLLAKLDIPISKVLHGEQSFRYYQPACVGDTVTVNSRIVNIYVKKNGALEFIVKASKAFNQHGELVAEMRSVLVCRHSTP
jgi:acyl dehydratase